jgi:hypothetical protein
MGGFQDIYMEIYEFVLRSHMATLEVANNQVLASIGVDQLS